MISKEKLLSQLLLINPILLACIQQMSIHNSHNMAQKQQLCSAACFINQINCDIVLWVAAMLNIHHLTQLSPQ